MEHDYDIPRVTDIAEKVLDGLVPEGQIGTARAPVYDLYQDMDVYEQVDESDFDFILLKRRLGYLDQNSFTDIAGLEVQTFAKTVDRAEDLMEAVTKRLLEAEYTTVDGFQIDYVEILNGPEEGYPEVMDDRMVEKNFELQIRVRWH